MNNQNNNSGGNPLHLLIGGIIGALLGFGITSLFDAPNFAALIGSILGMAIVTVSRMKK